MLKRCGIGLLIVLNLSGQLTAQDSVSVSLDGYVKDMQIVQWADINNSVYLIDLVHNRLTTRWQYGKWSARLDVRNRIFIGDISFVSPDLGHSLEEDPGWWDLSWVWIDKPEVTAHTITDRAYLQYSGEKWDITLGRQRINWGIHNIWNPNDIFNAYNFLDFDYEERPGSDALRVRTYLPNNRTLEVAVAIAGEEEEVTAAALYAWNTHRFDLQVMSGLFRSDAVLGGGWAGHIGDMGWKGECSYFIPVGSAASAGQVLTATTGVDRSFANDWYASLSALYVSDPEEDALLQAGDITRTAKSLFPFVWSVHAMGMYAVSPIQSAAFSCVWAPEEDILVLLPMYSWELADAFDLDVTAQSFFGTYDGGFRHQFTAWYLRGRWSF